MNRICKPGYGPALVVAMLFAPAKSLCDEQTDLLRAVADGYQANRDSFSHMVVHSVVTQGKAQSVEKALEGHYLDQTLVVARGYYAFDGTTHRADLLYPPELQRKFRVKIDDHRSRTRFASQRESGNGSVLITHFPDNQHASVQSRQSRSLPYQLVRPFDMGINGGRGDLAIDRMILRFLEGRLGSATFEGETQRDGRTLWVINSTQFGVTVRFWIDPRRGFLPIYREHSPGGTSFKLVEIRQCSEARWLPARGITVLAPGTTPDGPVSFRETRLGDVDFDSPPQPEKIRLDLPVGTTISDGIARVTWKAGLEGRPTSLQPSDIDSSQVRTASPSEQVHVPDQERQRQAATTSLAPMQFGPPETRANRRAWLNWMIFGVIVLSGVIGTVWWYQRR